MIPMVGQVANMYLGQFTKEKYDDRLSLSPVVQQLENSGKAFFSVYKTTQGDELKGYELRNMLSTLGFLTGTPIAPIGKSVGYVTDVNDGRAEPTGIIDFGRGMISGRSGSK